jgi:hypothetical protein
VANERKRNSEIYSGDFFKDSRQPERADRRSTINLGYEKPSQLMFSCTFKTLLGKTAFELPFLGPVSNERLSPASCAFDGREISSAQRFKIQ